MKEQIRVVAHYMNIKLLRITILSLFISCLYVGYFPTAAQSIEPIGVAELKTATLSKDAPQQLYSLVAHANETLDIEIRRVTGDIVPQFTILRGGESMGIWYAYAHGSVGDDLAGGLIRFPADGEYTIKVVSRYPQTTSGAYVLSVNATIPPTPLAVNQNSSGEIVAGETRVFAFQSIPQSQLVAVVELKSSGPGVVVRLRNSRNDILGSFEPPVEQGQFNIPQGQRDYTLEIVNGSAASIAAFTVNLSSSGSASPGVELGANGLPIMPNSGDCIVATRSTTPVNVRPDASTNQPAFTVISPTSIYPVAGRNADGTWYQIQINGRVGWVAALVTRLGGNCESIPTK
ncbi:MAG: hypothetical protein R3E39_15690 [Anaerolineae bacterium]